MIEVLNMTEVTEALQKIAEGKQVLQQKFQSVCTRLDALDAEKAELTAARDLLMAETGVVSYKVPDPAPSALPLSEVMNPTLVAAVKEVLTLPDVPAITGERATRKRQRTSIDENGRPTAEWMARNRKEREAFLDRERTQAPTPEQETFTREVIEWLTRTKPESSVSTREIREYSAKRTDMNLHNAFEAITGHTTLNSEASNAVIAALARCRKLSVKGYAIQPRFYLNKLSWSLVSSANETADVRVAKPKAKGMDSHLHTKSLPLTEAERTFFVAFVPWLATTKMNEAKAGRGMTAASILLLMATENHALYALFKAASDAIVRGISASTLGIILGRGENMVSGRYQLRARHGRYTYWSVATV